MASSHGEMDFSNCLSFRQRMIAKKAFGENNRNKFRFFNRFFDAIIGISLAQSVHGGEDVRASSLLSRKRTVTNHRRNLVSFVEGIEE